MLRIEKVKLSLPQVLSQSQFLFVIELGSGGWKCWVQDRLLAGLVERVGEGSNVWLGAHQPGDHVGGAIVGFQFVCLRETVPDFIGECSVLLNDLLGSVVLQFGGYKAFVFLINLIAHQNYPNIFPSPLLPSDFKYYDFLNGANKPVRICLICSFWQQIIIGHNKMKNIELYRTIEALVESKKQQYTPNKPSFAHQYCKKEIQKKKLVPFNPKSKMSKIMKNFHQLDTYVNVEQLFECINQKISERKKEDKPHTLFKWKSKQQIVFDDEEAIEKVRQKLGPYNQRIYLKENQQMLDVIKKLEEESNVASHRKQNSPYSDDINFYKANSNCEEEVNKFSAQKEKWRYYEGNNYIFEEASQKRPIRSQIYKLATEKPSLRKRQQKRDLIHQVSTYLQIILENHHKKKWGNNKVKVDETTMPRQEEKRQLKSAQKEKTKKVVFEISRSSTRYTDHKSSFQRSALSSQKTSLQNSVLVMKKSNSSISQKQSKNEVDKYRAKKVGVNQNFTFRNRNIKQNLMKKINNFLEFVESEQKQFKKQKNYEISELESIENKEKINEHNLCGNNFMVDDYELRAVQKIVHMQK